MLDYNDRPSSTTTMGYVFPLINAVHGRALDCDDYYDSIVIEEDYLQNGQ